MSLNDTNQQVRSDLSLYSKICGGWATFKNFAMEGVLMLNFVPFFGNVHGVALEEQCKVL